MNRKILAAAAAMLLALCVQAENLVVNADFTQFKGSQAAGWSKVGKLNIDFQSKDGSRPEIGYAVFSTAGEKLQGSIRQSMRNKVEIGKKYRLSADFRGENFKAGDYGILLINTNWKGNVGIRRFKLREDGKWRTMRKDVTVPAAWTSVTLVVFAYDLQGKLFVSNIKCEPVAE